LLKLTLIFFVLTFLTSCDCYRRISGTVLDNRTGKSIDIQIYCDDETEAYFPGGVKNWMKAVTRNFNKKVLITNKAPTGTYSVFVTFMITKNGTISHVKPKTHFGYGIEDEIIRAIKKCPKWEPATSCGKKKNTYLEQVITIVVP